MSGSEKLQIPGDRLPSEDDLDEFKTRRYNSIEEILTTLSSWGLNVDNLERFIDEDGNDNLRPKDDPIGLVRYREGGLYLGTDAKLYIRATKYGYKERERLTADNFPSDKRHYIAAGGGKAGLYYALRGNSGLSSLMPDAVYLQPGEDFSVIESEIDDESTDFTSVRACHSGDVRGLVDIINTKVARGRREIARAIDRIREAASFEEVKKYFEYELRRSADPAQEIGILIQKFAYPTIIGSMIEHPYRKGLFIIERRATKTDHPLDPNIIHTTICDENAREWSLGSLVVGAFLDNRRFTFDSGFDLKFSDYSNPNNLWLIEAYQAIKASGILSDVALHIEFGERYQSWGRKEAENIFQVREFLPYGEVANFALPNKRSDCLPYFVFGTTPPEGIEMSFLPIEACGDLIRSRGNKLYGLDAAKANLTQTNVKMGYYYSTHDRKPPHISVMPRDMSAYFALNGDFLEHGHFRMIQKSPLTVIGGRLASFFTKYQSWKQSKDFLYDDGLVDIESLFTPLPLRVYSNGVFAHVERV